MRPALRTDGCSSANTWTPNTADTYVVNPFAIDTMTGRFRSASLGSIPRGNPWVGVTTTFASSTPVSVDAATTPTTFAIGELGPPLHLSSLHLLERRPHPQPQPPRLPMSRQRQDRPTPRRRASSPSSVKPTSTNITFTVLSLPSPVGQLVERDNVYVQYMLVPVSIAHRRFNPIPSSACPPSSDADRYNDNNAHPNVPDTVCSSTRPPVWFIRRAQSPDAPHARARHRLESTASRARTTRSLSRSRTARARDGRRGRDETTDGCFVPRTSTMRALMRR